MCIYLCVYIRTATMHETYFSVDVSLNIDKLNDEQIFLFIITGQQFDRYYFSISNLSIRITKYCNRWKIRNFIIFLFFLAKIIRNKDNNKTEF